MPRRPLRDSTTNEYKVNFRQKTKRPNQKRRVPQVGLAAPESRVQSAIQVRTETTESLERLEAEDHNPLGSRGLDT